MKSDASSSKRRGGAAGLGGFVAGATRVAARSLSFAFDQATSRVANAFAQRSARVGSGSRQVIFWFPVSVAMFESSAFSIVVVFSLGRLRATTCATVAGAVT